MKKIKLSNIHDYILVDDEDFLNVSNNNWFATTHNRKTRYVAFDERKEGKKKRVYMHRFLMGNPKGVVDHIDGNGFNNQKKNLRVCSIAENLRNRGLPKSNTSGVKGVDFHKQTGKFRVRITVNRKEHHLGLFSTLYEAKRIREKFIGKFHKEFAHV